MVGFVVVGRRTCTERERDTHARTHRDRGDTERERERLSFFLGLDRSFFSEVLVNFFFRLQSA
jgi:hypothetical protein